MCNGRAISLLACIRVCIGEYASELCVLHGPWATRCELPMTRLWGLRLILILPLHLRWGQAIDNDTPTPQ